MTSLNKITFTLSRAYQILPAGIAVFRLKYYVDNHSIFRYVERRDSVWRKFETMKEQAVVQWKEVLNDLSIEVVYALSPVAKGKVERPYHWLQDHLVRTCVREEIHEHRSSSASAL